MMLGEYDKMNEKIISMQGLRGIAFLAIFIFHCTGSRGFGAWGVSVFLILSGFLMVYNYYGKQRIKNASVKANLKFAIMKIKGLYKLHIITMLAMLPFLFLGTDKDSLQTICIKLILNILLVQEWLPMSYRSINPVSWYLSVSFFCYFIYPFIEKKLNKNKCIVFIVGIVIFQIIVGTIIGGFVCKSDMLLNYEVNLIRWLFYYSPIVRCLEFIIGCNLAYIFINYKISGFIVKNHHIVTIIIILWIIVDIFIYKNAFRMQENTYSSPNVWWVYGMIFEFANCLLIYIGSIKQTGIAKILSNKLLVCIGDYSKYAYLIHYVVISYVNGFFIVFFSDSKEFLFAKLIISSILTIIFTWLWERFERIKSIRKGFISCLCRSANNKN